ncbi:MAG: hypothetical protein ACTHQ3_06900 [Motilibacteraceae bacterium]
MTKMRQWSLLAGLAVVAVLAAGWFLLVSPKRGEASDLRAQTVSQQQQNQQLQAKLEQLKAQAKDLPAQQAKLADFHLRIPDNPALPTLVRDLTKATKAAGTDLVSLAPGQPAALTPAAATAPVAPASGAAAGTSAAGAASPLFAVPVQLHVTGTYPQVELFINQLEGLKRSFLVTGFQLGQTKDAGSAGSADTSASRDLDLQLDGRVFVAPTTATPATAVKPVASPAPAPAK